VIFWIEKRSNMDEVTKKCSKCGTYRTLSEFCKHKGRLFGVHSICKFCKIKMQAIYRKSEKGAQVERENSKKQRILYPEKAKAKSYINHRVEKGTFPRANTKKCLYCNSVAEEYHHPDYSRPFFVEPVCLKCHRKIHSREERMLP
jgi:hypothetical protein